MHPLKVAFHLPKKISKRDNLSFTDFNDDFYFYKTILAVLHPSIVLGKKHTNRNIFHKFDVTELIGGGN